MRRPVELRVTRRPSLSVSRLAYGQPRTVEVTAGRSFVDVGHPRAMKLMEADGPNARLHYVVAESAVWGLSILAALGLAPGPSDWYNEWLAKRQYLLLGESVALTARYTWDAFALHTSFELAVTSLACVQGFYRNSYAALLHFDTNRYGESWTLCRSEALAAWARAAGLEVMPTHVPQLFVALHTTPNKTVWTAFLQNLLHAGSEQPDASVERPDGWTPSRGAGEVFALQARGTKDYGSGQFFVRFRAYGASPSCVSATSK